MDSVLQMLSQPFGIATIAGLAGFFFTQWAKKFDLSQSQKLVIPIVAVIVLTLLGMAITQWPDAWEKIAAVIMSAAGTAQIVYAAWKTGKNAVDSKTLKREVSRMAVVTPEEAADPENVEGDGAWPADAIIIDPSTLADGVIPGADSDGEN